MVLVATLFAAALFIGTASIALWIDCRKPSLAPNGLKWRALCAVVTIQACTMVPIGDTSFLALYSSIFGALVPVLILMWLTTLWVLRAISEAVVAHH
jgi:hypothetical protein